MGPVDLLVARNSVPVSTQQSGIEAELPRLIYLNQSQIRVGRI
jgi:hypothetical protein